MQAKRKLTPDELELAKELDRVRSETRWNARDWVRRELNEREEEVRIQYKQGQIRGRKLKAQKELINADRNTQNASA